jgi:AcrR family transcriptional regulator
MPKETFFNLPPEKRAKIEEAAIREFVEYSFDNASVNRIVTGSGIPKGSFYQYFEDKKDLYKHIMSLIIAKKMEYLSPVMRNPFDHDFFVIVKEMYETGLHFARDNPDFVVIGNRLRSDPSHQLFKEIIEDNIDKSNQVFEQLLTLGIQRGEIRPDIDLGLTAHLISALNVEISEYYQKHIAKKDDYFYDDGVLVTIGKFLDLLKFGIGQA